MTARQSANTHGDAYVYVNGEEIAHSQRGAYKSYPGYVSVSVTLKLQQNDKVKAKFEDSVNNLNEPKTTYFEGRLISKLESSQPRIPVYGPRYRPRGKRHS